jgi:putative acetyltransferase
MTSGATSPPDVLHFVVRHEAPDDVMVIDEVIRAAFRDHPFSQQTEHLIVRGLRAAGALNPSLVATLEGSVVGHLALSPVTIGAMDSGWWGLGPVSVVPAHQRSGIGSALIRSGLRRLRERRVAGCVVLGDPAYYGRFGFAPQAGPVCPGPPADHFMALALDSVVPIGEVKYHPAFYC